MPIPDIFTVFLGIIGGCIYATIMYMIIDYIFRRNGKDDT